MAEMASSDRYEIQPATPEQAEALTIINQKAFQSNPATRMLFPTSRAHLSTPEEVTNWRVGRLRARVESSKSHSFVLVDKTDSNKIIGYAEWCPPGTVIEDTPLFHPNQKSPEECEQEAPTEGNAGSVEALDPAALKAFIDCLADRKKEIWGGDNNYWYLGSLFTDPDYRRQGHGKRLLQYGLDQSRAQGLPIYLESTEAGLPLYTSVGFQALPPSKLFDGLATVTPCIWKP